MPTRVWVMIAAMIVVLGGAFIALTIAVPDPATVTAGSATSPDLPDPAAAERRAAAAAAQAAADAAEAASAAAAATAETIATEAAALSRDLLALATAMQTDLPRTDGRVTQTAAYASDRELTLTYDIAIDPGTFQPESDSTPLAPGFEAYRCDRGTCYRFAAAFKDIPCTDATLNPLLARGAVLIYSYRDANQQPLPGGEKRADWDLCFNG